VADFSLSRRVSAEFVGTALLAAAVVGSGIMAEQLAAGNAAIALLANTIATGAVLVALILAFGPISGAHFVGSVAGVISAHAMFGTALLAPSQHARSGAGQVLSEAVATFGLLSVIWGCSRTRSSLVAFAVGAYITAAYWFTASTSFANPAITVARALTDTFAGIRPADVPAFLLAQAIGAAAATALFRWLLGAPARAGSAAASRDVNSRATV
jgi:glycerol uptake facilitator-like aquaporin